MQAIEIGGPCGKNGCSRLEAIYGMGYLVQTVLREEGIRQDSNFEK